AAFTTSSTYQYECGHCSLRNSFLHIGHRPLRSKTISFIYRVRRVLDVRPMPTHTCKLPVLCRSNHAVPCHGADHAPNADIRCMGNLGFVGYSDTCPIPSGQETRCLVQTSP